MIAVILIVALVGSAFCAMLYYESRDIRHELFLMTGKVSVLENDLKKVVSLVVDCPHKFELIEINKKIFLFKEDIEDMRRINNKKFSDCFSSEQAVALFEKAIGSVKMNLEELSAIVEVDRSLYLRKDSLQTELEKYYEDVEKRIKDAKEEVWKSRTKAFSLPTGGTNS
jgi:hypothetical protein